MLALREAWTSLTRPLTWHEGCAMGVFLFVVVLLLV